MTKIKICGLWREEDISYINEYQPDYIGFVFAKSKRQVSIDKAKQLRAMVQIKGQVVGVFVDEKREVIEQIVKDGIIDMVQLHGKEDALYIQQLKQKIEVEIIKAIAIKSPQDLENINYDVDYYLLDNKVAGSGKSFDWNWITKINKPFFLAGGITIDTLEEALHVPCFGIDVSSGVETQGIKDKIKIKEIIGRLRDGKR